MSLSGRELREILLNSEVRWNSIQADTSNYYDSNSEIVTRMMEDKGRFTLLLNNPNISSIYSKLSAVMQVITTRVPQANTNNTNNNAGSITHQKAHIIFEILNNILDEILVRGLNKNYNSILNTISDISTTFNNDAETIRRLRTFKATIDAFVEGSVEVSNEETDSVSGTLEALGQILDMNGVPHSATNTTTVTQINAREFISSPTLPALPSPAAQVRDPSIITNPLASAPVDAGMDREIPAVFDGVAFSEEVKTKYYIPIAAYTSNRLSRARSCRFCGQGGRIWLKNRTSHSFRLIEPDGSRPHLCDVFREHLINTRNITIPENKVTFWSRNPERNNQSTSPDPPTERRLG